ncbi:hypothetical protein BGZ76_000572 [Entomortierella beljakovae]|nr:hypothetical protein BGZ76_000572 [Entomortierella beljakovae]
MYKSCPLPKHYLSGPMQDMLKGTKFMDLIAQKPVKSSPNFTDHNGPTEFSCVDLAFTIWSEPDNRNQIEYFLDETYGGSHEADLVIESLPGDTLQEFCS